LKISINIYSYCRGYITSDQFWYSIVKSVALNTILVPVNAIGVGLGTFIALKVSKNDLFVQLCEFTGGLVVSYLGSLAIEKIFGLIWDKFTNKKPEEMINRCLKLYDVDIDVDEGVLKAKYNEYIRLYNPGSVSDPKIKKEFEQKFKLYCVAYNVVSSAIQSRKTRPKRMKFKQFYLH
jgi:hypothetical protein